MSDFSTRISCYPCSPSSTSSWMPFVPDARTVGENGVALVKLEYDDATPPVFLMPGQIPQSTRPFRTHGHWYPDHEIGARMPHNVTGFVQNAADEYAIEVDGQWRAIVDGVAYCGFESRLEALTFAAAKYAELRYRADG